MGYNPDQNVFEPLAAQEADIPVAKRHWTRFQEGETLELKGILFRVHEIGESRIVLKPLKVA